MCQKGVNTDQMKLMIAQANDALGMAQQWLEQIHHLADSADLTGPSTAVAQASVLLGEARAKLENAADEVDGQTAGPDISEIFPIPACVQTVCTVYPCQWPRSPSAR